MAERIGTLNLYGDSVEVNTDNVSLWTHKHEPEIDHVYVRLPERYNDGEQRQAFYLWRHIGASAAAFTLFHDELIGRDDVEKHTAINEAAETDRAHFEAAAAKEMNHLWDDPKLW